jgi:hypothetical protein
VDDGQRTVEEEQVDVETEVTRAEVTRTEVAREVEDVSASAADPHGTTPAGGGADELAKVRELVLLAHPEVVPELVRGRSLDELLASVAPARSAYQQVAARVRDGMPAAVPVAPDAATAGDPAASAATDPATSPPRVPAGGTSIVVNPDDIPPAEKIARALAGRTITG